MKKDQLIFIALCFCSVAIAALFGLSEETGLFGAILSGGTFILNVSHNGIKGT